MGNDDITLVSTTDSPEQVQAALTGKPEAPKAPAEPAAPPPAEPPVTPPAEPPAADAAAPAGTPEEQADREASEAGKKLAAHAKRKNQIQQEIDELIWKKHQARSDIEAEEARLNELRRQRAELDTPPPKSPSDKPAVAAKADKGGKKGDDDPAEPQLDATGADGNAKYATYEDYLSDHAKWTREMAERAARRVVEQERATDRERIERESANRAVQERLALYNKNLETFKQTHADFDAAFEEAKAEVRDALVALGPDAMKVVDGFTIFDAEDGPALSYYLVKHPDELKAIAMKAPPQQLIHLSRLEERIRQGGVTQSPPARPPAAPTETKAPEPIKPVGSGPTATTVPLDEAEFQDYKARREREIRARRSA